MATAQRQDTGKAGGETGGEAPTSGHEDPFGDTFAALSVEEPVKIVKPDPVLDGVPQPEAEEKPAPQGLPDPTQVGADGLLKGEETPAGEKPAAKEPAKPAEQSAGKLTDEQWLDRFREIVRPEPVAEKPAAAANSPITPFSADEQELVDTVRREWPDVVAALALERRQEYQALTDHIFKELRPYLTHLTTQTTEIVNQSHTERLHAAVPDYDEVAPKVLEWVAQQPAYLRPAYEQVTKSGSLGDVVDLIGRYRAATGTEAPAAQQRPAAEAQAEQRPAAKPNALRALAPVAGKRTGVASAGIASDDFDGAFKQFAASA